MKKVLTVFVICFFVLCNIAFAGEMVKTIIDTTLDDDPTGSTSDSVTMFPGKAFLVEYDETEVGNSVSATVTFQVSFDGTTWVTAPFLDVAGGVTPQTSETISSDTDYFMYVDRNVVAPFFRIGVAGNNTDADDTIDLTVTYISKE